jgi:hypothetical protein
MAKLRLQLRAVHDSLNGVKRLFRRIQRSPLKAYSISAVSLIILVAVAWRFFIPLAGILLVGIGDGYPSAAMQLIGCIILAAIAPSSLALSSIAMAAFVLVEIDKTRSMIFKLAVLATTFLSVGCLSFAAWLHGRDDAVVDAIISGNIRRYEAAARWRVSGNLDDDLWLAARWGRLDIVKLLVARGASPAKSKYGSSLESARENLGKQPNGNQQVVDFLLTNNPSSGTESKY